MELANPERVKDLLSSLAKAQREYKTYPAKHPVLLKRREELFAKFEFVLAKSAELVKEGVRKIALVPEPAGAGAATSRDPRVHGVFTFLKGISGVLDRWNYGINVTRHLLSDDAAPVLTF